MIEKIFAINLSPDNKDIKFHCSECGVRFRGGEWGYDDEEWSGLDYFMFCPWCGREIINTDAFEFDNDNLMEGKYGNFKEDTRGTESPEKSV